jgi:hypothetical protein
MIPEAYRLKRHVRQGRARFWRGECLAGIVAAPAFVFTDQERFDSDEVDVIGRLISATALKLPHPAVIFEIRDRGPLFHSQVVYARQLGESVEAVYFAQDRSTRRWSDVIAHARFTPEGYADIETHPSITRSADREKYAEVTAAIVWRSLAILSQASVVSERTVSKLHRPKLAGVGITGWTWHQVEIVPERLVRTAEPQGGSHASPRWHIRRGHWRQLCDGRRVFVRACEVGDAAQGGIVKDYLVGARAA